MRSLIILIVVISIGVLYLSFHKENSIDHKEEKVLTKLKNKEDGKEVEKLYLYALASNILLTPEYIKPILKENCSNIEAAYSNIEVYFSVLNKQINELFAMKDKFSTEVQPLFSDLQDLFLRKQKKIKLENRSNLKKSFEVQEGSKQILCNSMFKVLEKEYDVKRYQYFLNKLNKFKSKYI